MKRRDFLKLGSVVSALSYASVAPLGKMLSMPIETAAQGIIYRGTATGKIYTSKNGGKTWQLHTNLGKAYSVLDIFTARDGHLYTQVGFKQHNFFLVQTADRKYWASRPLKSTPKHQS